jgi:hypothetical protein
MSARDPAAFEAIARRGRAALAWEVLRRDPAYRAAYAALTASGRSVDSAFVADWGLHFR